MMIGLTPSEKLANKSLKIIEKVFLNNTSSDYTEKIHILEQQFDYNSNSNYYWSKPEQSVFYGTPLYQQASESQKMTLNHLYWAMQYSKVPADEASTMFFNQVTNSVFQNMGGFTTLCQELDMETNQEKYHIHAFQRISRLTKKALLGSKNFKQSYQQTKLNLEHKFNFWNNPISYSKKFKLPNFLVHSSYSTLRLINKLVLENQGRQPCQYLQDLEDKHQIIQVPTEGVISRTPFRRFTMHLLTLNFGTSPFLASHYYSIRLIANMMLKNWEFNYSHFFRDLETKSAFIPIPTAISYLHFLDESFHTTTSKTIAQIYKLFSKPSIYEQWVANLTLYLMQMNLNGLSAVLPYRFIKDNSVFIAFFYQLLQSPIFEMSSVEALNWLEKCFCQEHDGFYFNLKYHQRLLSNFRDFFNDVDYLWSNNRTMSLMASGNSIEKAIQKNIKDFTKFSRSVTSS